MLSARVVRFRSQLTVSSVESMLSLVSICHECEELSFSGVQARVRHTRVLALGYPQSFVADLRIVGFFVLYH